MGYSQVSCKQYDRGVFRWCNPIPAFDFASSSDGVNNNLSDLLSALESLGYRRIDIIEIAQKLTQENPSLGVEKLVPMALKNITK